MSSRTRLLLFIALALVTATCVRLGLWQVARLRERRAENAIAAAAMAQPELDLGSSPALPYRRVRATGAYDHAHDIVLRGQSHREQPGVSSVTPLRLRGQEPAVLVARGFVPAADATSAQPDSLREPGVVTVRGVAMPIVTRTDGGAPLTRGGRTTWRGLDREALEAQIGYPLSGYYVAQLPDSALPRFPRRLSPPPLSDGPHLSYAIQWFAFATIAVVGGTVLLGVRPRGAEDQGRPSSS
jgi:surfeit locus 1 family protein